MDQEGLTGERIPIIELPDGVTIKTVKAGNAYGEKQSVTVTLIPTTFAVHQNYPNPFNPITRVQIDLPEITQVSVVVYDVMGREVKALINEEFLPGYHTLTWNGNNTHGSPVSSGVYFISVFTPDRVKTIKAILLR